MHNNEEDSGNCFYVSGITQRATIVREAAYLQPVRRRWWCGAAGERPRRTATARGWKRTRTSKGVGEGACVSTVSRTDAEGSTAGHYASLGNLANDSIEAAGMSSMWT